MTSVSVLLVEDNPFIRKMMKGALDGEGYVVVEAPDASTALDAARIRLPDLVLLDPVLPDMDGIELARHLRALSGGADLPILALSAVGNQSENDGPCEFTAFLPKPLGSSRVLEAVEAHLVAWRSRNSSAARVKKRCRVLVVDDEPVERRWLQTQLKQLGLEVATASSGAEALALASQLPPQIIVSDVRTSPMDGFQLCERIRQEDRLSKVRVVLTSSKSIEAHEAELALQLGADAFAPMSSELIEVVKELVEATRSPSSFPPAAPSDSADSYAGQLGQLHAQASLGAPAAPSSDVLGLVSNLLGRVNDMCSRPLEIERTLGDLLATYLGAYGFDLGAVFMQQEGGELKLGARFGNSDWTERLGPAFFGYETWLRELLDRNALVGWTATMPPLPPIGEIVSSLDIGSLLVVPLGFGADRRGIMVLGSRAPDMPPNWEELAKALQGSLAQTMALGQTVAKLAVSEQRFRGIAEATGDGIVATDLGGRIFYANPAAARMFDIPHLAGVSIRLLCPILEDPNAAGAAFGLRANGDQFPLELHTYTCDDSFAGPHQIHVLRDLTDRQACEELSRMANRDPLTDLWNRRRFDEELRQRLNEASRYAGTGALLLLDLDEFKGVNDTLGHAAGDAVLKRVARVLVRATRGSDVVARLGGDEFAVLLPHVDEDGARRCAERIVAELGLSEVVAHGQRSGPVGSSIGVALFPLHAVDPDLLFECADQALYQSKRAGRRRVTMYAPEKGAPPRISSGIRMQTIDSALPTAAGLAHGAKELS